MTLIEIQPGTAVNPAEVLGVKRADYRSAETRTDHVRTQIDCTHGRTYLVEVPFETVLGLLNLKQEEPPKPPRDERPHSRSCGILPHEHGTACGRDCPTCHGRTAG